MLATAWRRSSGILLKGTPSSHATTLRKPRPSMATRSRTNDTPARVALTIPMAPKVSAPASAEVTANAIITAVSATWKNEAQTKSLADDRLCPGTDLSRGKQQRFELTSPPEASHADRAHTAPPFYSAEATSSTTHGPSTASSALPAR